MVGTGSDPLQEGPVIGLQHKKHVLNDGQKAREQKTHSGFLWLKSSMHNSYRNACKKLWTETRSPIVKESKRTTKGLLQP